MNAKLKVVSFTCFFKIVAMPTSVSAGGNAPLKFLTWKFATAVEDIFDDFREISRLIDGKKER